VTVPLDDLARFAQSIDPLVELSEPADPRDIQSAEAAIGVAFPNELRQFLLRSDGAALGIRLTTGQTIGHASSLIWCVSEIVKRNRAAASAINADSHVRLLLFADAGVDGLFFGHPIADDGTATDAVGSITRSTSVP
jgi:hypothetical protein